MGFWPQRIVAVIVSVSLASTASLAGAADRVVSTSAPNQNYQIPSQTTANKALVDANVFAQSPSLSSRFIDTSVHSVTLNPVSIPTPSAATTRSVTLPTTSGLTPTAATSLPTSQTQTATTPSGTTRAATTTGTTSTTGTTTPAATSATASTSSSSSGSSSSWTSWALPALMIVSSLGNGGLFGKSGSGSSGNSLISLLPIVGLLASLKGGNMGTLLPWMILLATGGGLSSLGNLFGGSKGSGVPGDTSGGSNNLSMIKMLLTGFMLYSAFKKQNNQDPPVQLTGLNQATGQTATFTRAAQTSSNNSNNNNSNLLSLLPSLMQSRSGNSSGDSSGGLDLMQFLPTLMATQSLGGSSSTTSPDESHWVLDGETGNWQRKVDANGQNVFVPTGQHTLATGDTILYDGTGQRLVWHEAKTGYTFSKADANGVYQTNILDLQKVDKGPDGIELDRVTTSQLQTLAQFKDSTLFSNSQFDFSTLTNSSIQILQATSSGQMSAQDIEALGLSASPPVNLFKAQITQDANGNPTDVTLIRIGYHLNSDNTWTLYDLNGNILRSGDGKGNIKDTAGKVLIAAQAPLDLGRLGTGTATKLVLDQTTGLYMDKTSGVAYQQATGLQNLVYKPVKVLDANGNPVTATDASGNAIVDAKGQSIPVAYKDQKGQSYFQTKSGDLLPVINPIPDPDAAGAELQLVVSDASRGVYQDPGSNRTFIFQQANSSNNNTSGLNPYTGTFKIDGNNTGIYVAGTNGARVLSQIQATLPSGKAAVLNRIDDAHYQTTTNQVYQVAINNGTPQYTEYTGTFPHGSLTFVLNQTHIQKISDSQGNSVSFDASGSIPTSMTTQGKTLAVAQRITNTNGTFDTSAVTHITQNGLSLPQAYRILETTDNQGNITTTLPEVQYTYDVNTSNASDQTITVTNAVTGETGVWHYNGSGNLTQCTGPSTACSAGFLPTKESFPVQTGGLGL